MEGSERPPEEERRSPYKRTFQPLERSVSKDRTHLGISNSKEAATGSILIDQPELWKKTVAEKTGTYLSDARKEIIDKTRPKTNEMIEFRPGRDPKEALEGDLIRFLHRNHDNNSISWLQGRLVSRLDDLEDTIRNEWTKNRFIVDITDIINYWGNPGITPSSTTVNITHGTKWALGLESSQVGNTDERLSLGCHEAIYMGLIEQGPESEGSNEKPTAICHTYEVLLVDPGNY